MASYEKQFVKPYEEGWQNLPSEDTPIRADILNDYDSTLERIENYLGDNDIPPDLTEDVTELNQSFTQLYSDGYASRNLFDATRALIGISWNLDKVATRTIVNMSVEPNTKYTISRDNLTGYSATRIFEKTSENEKTAINEIVSISNMVLTTSANTHCLTFLFVVDSGVIDVAKILSNKIQVEKGEVAHSYTPFAKSNTDLTQIVDSAIEDGYLPKAKLSAEIQLGKNYDKSNLAKRALICYDVTPSKEYQIGIKNTSVANNIFIAYMQTKASTSAISFVNMADLSDGKVLATPSNCNYLIVCIDSKNASITQAEVDTVGITLVEYLPSNAELNKSLTPSEFITSGLSFTGCSLVSGGYCKVGKLVIVDMQISLTTALTSLTAIISGMPKSIKSATNLSCSTWNDNNNQVPVMMISDDGKLYAMRLLNGSVYVSGVYISQ